MQITPEEYFKFLENKFAYDWLVFCTIIESFDTESKTTKDLAFVNFWAKKYPSIPFDSELCNYALELFVTVRAITPSVTHL